MIVSLNEAKSFIGIALDDVSNDVILQIILDSTEEQIRDFCHKHDSPEIIGGDGTVAPAVTYTFKASTKLAQLKWIQMEYTKQIQGANGIQSESIAGQSTTYVQGIPEDILDKLYLEKRVVVI